MILRQLSLERERKVGFIEITAMRHRRALSKYPLDNFCPRRDDDVYERDIGLYGSVLKRPRCDTNGESETERRWVLLKIPRCDIDGVGEGK